MILKLVRDIFDTRFTLGKLWADDVFIGYTCEDTDRHLETQGHVKVYGQTCIPRGQYEVILSYSQRFGRIMPEVLNVPEFSGVRIHGGNTAENTLGCPLLGSERTTIGVMRCAEVNARLGEIIKCAKAQGKKVILDVQ